MCFVVCMLWYHTYKWTTFLRIVMYLGNSLMTKMMIFGYSTEPIICWKQCAWQWAKNWGAFFMCDLCAGKPLVKCLGIRRGVFNRISWQATRPWFPQGENSFQIRNSLKEHPRGEALIQRPLAFSLYKAATHVNINAIPHQYNIICSNCRADSWLASNQ